MITDMQDYFAPEELCEELKRRLFQDGPLGPYINHPLYVTPMHAPEWNRHANKALAIKKEEEKRMIAEGKWSSYIGCLIEKPFRMEYLLKFQHQIPEDQYWGVLKDVWSMVENHWQNLFFIRRLFKDKHGNIPELFSPEDKAAFDAMPGDRICIYRGCQRRNMKGWSWTVNPDKAWWFAKRYTPKNPIVVKVTKFPKAKVLFYAHEDGRGENEVVVDPVDAFAKYPESRMTIQTKPTLGNRQKGRNEVNKNGGTAVQGGTDQGGADRSD